MTLICISNLRPLPAVLLFLSDLGMPCILDFPSLTTPFFPPSLSLSLSLSLLFFSILLHRRPLFLFTFFLGLCTSPLLLPAPPPLPPFSPSVYLGVLSLIRAFAPSWRPTRLSSSMSSFNLTCPFLHLSYALATH